MAGILFATCLMLAAAVASGAHGSPTPAPSSKPTDCSMIIYNMANCMPFLSKAGKDMKPDSSCCTGFKSVLKVNAECICEALKSSASLGLDLNMTKAVTLPSDCGVSATAPPISKCGIPSPPGEAPVKPPSPTKKRTPPPAPSKKTPPPAPSEPSPQAPAPAPSAHSGSSRTCGSFKVIILSVVLGFLIFRIA
ncbi:non-specific lipid transfer protein GPI-anchored 31-like [Mangifera indica]|uniref:non-specific lipid transfer protein GPI-anchored 31-like n=1 Tax=Mangifera indica TaxID=29780 RepID=UPI001CF95695|nr:non-specific lipid transfer protein GPI-anchored 31-like [Mangifera indica]